ncbi:COG3400 family protein [Sulfurospirillum sp. 1307]
MKKILIIADGTLAKHFLERIMHQGSSDNLFDVVTYRDKTVPSKKLENFNFYSFDPTSYEKISPLLARDYYQIMIIVSKKIDAIGSYNNIRSINKDVQVIMMDRWELDIDDDRLEILDSKAVLSSRFVDFLPDMPVIAQNVGLGAGEIMEIRVPIGSSYVYRHIGSIAQKKWKIAGIYRANKLILPRPTLMIQPNDILLVIGDPVVLQSVYRSIKQDLGQFPSPFGNSIYCLIDMKNMSKRSIDTLLNDAMLIHSKINSVKLYIKVINPTYTEQFEKIKSYDSKYIVVNIDFYEDNANKVLKDDLEKLDIGLIVVDGEFFNENLKALYASKLPVLKIGAWGFLSLREGVVLSSNSEDIEKESAVIFDVSSQLDLKIKLYNFNPDNSTEANSLVEYFDNLSKLFSRKVEIVETRKNPLLKLRNKDDILQFVPFNSKILEPSMLSVFSTDMERLYFKLSNSYQLFIPVSV